MAYRDDIAANTTRNLERVKNLAKIYKDQLAGTGTGRRPVNSADVLRAATVLLHATLEDFLRDLARWKLPIAAAESLEEIPIAGSSGKANRFNLGAVAKHRGKSVEDLITESVLEFLSQETYNNVSDIKKFLSSIDVDDSLVDSYATELGHLMDRRHHIVHRADKNESAGTGHYQAKSISHALVVRWIRAVESFSTAVLEAV